MTYEAARLSVTDYPINSLDKITAREIIWNNVELDKNLKRNKIFISAEKEKKW